MSAADRKVTTEVFNKTVDEMVVVLHEQPPFLDDTPWTYEVEADGITFWENGVFVERWVQR